MTVVERVIFNDSIIQGGLSCSVARSVSGVDGNGDIITANNPRFDRPRLLCGAPIVTKYGAQAANNIHMLGVSDGDTSEGYPLIAVQIAASATLLIHKGLSGFDKYWGDSDDSETIVKNLTGSNGTDLLAGQDGNDGGTAEFSDHRFTTDGNFHIFGDLIIACCACWDKGAGDTFRKQRVAVLYTTITRLLTVPDDAWILHAVGAPNPDAGESYTMMSRWASTLTQRGTGSNPTELYLKLCDYRGSPKDGRRDHTIRIRFDSGNWVFDEMIQTGTEATTDMHSHAGVVIDAGDHVWDYVATGDGASNAKGYLRKYEHGETWAGSAVTGSGISGSFQTNDPGAGWSAEETIHGPTGNQVIGFCQSITQGKALAAPDLSQDSLSLFHVEDITTERLAHFDTIDYLPSMWSKAGYSAGTGNESFIVRRRSIRGLNDDTHFIASDNPHSAGSGFGNGNPHRNKLIYSPDGTNFGQCFQVFEGNQAGPFIVGDRIIVGRVSAGLESMRLIPLPTTLLYEPLMLGHGPGNRIATTFSGTSGIGGNNTVTTTSRADIITAIGSYPPAQPGGWKIEFIDNVSCGFLRPMVNTAMPTLQVGDVVEAKFWFYVEPPEGDNDVRSAARFQTQVRVNQSGGTNPINAQTEDRWTAYGRWFPITFRLDINDIGGGDSTWGFELNILSRNISDFLAQTLYVVPEYVQVNNANPMRSFGQAAGTGGTEVSESAPVTGFTASDEWSLLLCGMVPDDSWDDEMSHAPASVVLATIDDGTDTVDIEVEPGTSRLTFAGVTDTNDLPVMRQAPVLCLIRHNADGSMTMNYSFGGSEIHQIEIESSDIGQLDEVLPGAMLMFRADYTDKLLSDAEAETALTTLEIADPPATSPVDLTITSPEVITNPDGDGVTWSNIANLSATPDTTVAQAEPNNQTTDFAAMTATPTNPISAGNSPTTLTVSVRKSRFNLGAAVTDAFVGISIDGTVKAANAAVGTGWPTSLADTVYEIDLTGISFTEQDITDINDGKMKILVAAQSGGEGLASLDSFHTATLAFEAAGGLIFDSLLTRLNNIPGIPNIPIS